MSIGLTDTVAAAEPTHRVVTRDLAGVDDWDDAGLVSVENRTMAVSMAYGTAVHLQLDSDHGDFETVRAELTQVPASDHVFLGPEPEYRAALPDDRALVEAILAIPEGDTDAWIDRLYYLDALAVVSGRTWVYRSVPHETHIREINANHHDDLVDDVNAELAHVRGSAVVPFDGVVSSWTADDGAYELRWNSLRRGDGETGHVADDLERLRYVSARGQPPTLNLDWRPVSEESLLRRLFWWITGSESADPPAELRLADGTDRRAVIDAFRRLGEDLEYSYAVDDTLYSS